MTEVREGGDDLFFYNVGWDADLFGWAALAFPAYVEREPPMCAAFDLYVPSENYESHKELARC